MSRMVIQRMTCHAVSYSIGSATHFGPEADITSYAVEHGIALDEIVLDQSWPDWDWVPVPFTRKVCPRNANHTQFRPVDIHHPPE